MPREKQEEEKIAFPELGVEVARRIDVLLLSIPKRYQEELELVALNFRGIGEDVEEFDGVLSDLYGWADTPLCTPKGEMQRKMCWVKTF